MKFCAPLIGTAAAIAAFAALYLFGFAGVELLVFPSLAGIAGLVGVRAACVACCHLRPKPRTSGR
jgi:hypothetical protein